MAGKIGQAVDLSDAQVLAMEKAAGRQRRNGKMPYIKRAPVKSDPTYDAVVWRLKASGHLDNPRRSPRMLTF